MTERTFTIAEICTAVGINPFCLHQWIERHQFEPIRETRAGVGRDYTLRDAIHLAAIVRLQVVGQTVSRAAVLIGTSPLQTAGQDIVGARKGDIEILIDLSSVAHDVRTRLHA